jgi:hypothetical protein
MLALLLFAQIGTVQFQTRMTPDTVYVGQQVSYDAFTFVDDIARTRLKNNPEYTPPDVNGVTVYDFPFDTAAITTVQSDGMTFRRYVYHRALFPLTPGTYDIPAASLSYSLPQSDSYYSDRSTYTAHSLPARFVALPLPESGKPLDFAGVVGQFSDTLYADGSAPRVGDGFTVTMRVSGVGNITLLPRPDLRVDWADVVPAEERVRWDSAGEAVRGAKEFDWVVTPKVAGALFIPPVRYEYFDPVTKQYAAAVTGTVPITVAGSGPAAPDSTLARPDTIGDTPFPMVLREIRAHPLVVVGAVALLLFLVIFIAIRARSETGGD